MMKNVHDTLEILIRLSVSDVILVEDDIQEDKILQSLTLSLLTFVAALTEKASDCSQVHQPHCKSIARNECVIRSVLIH